MRKLTAFVLLVFALSAQAQLYRWTDESGKVHYTDTQPPASAKNVEKKRRARGPDDGAQQSFALQQATKNFPVTVYTSRDCGEPCKQGLDYLKKRGVPFTEKVVTSQDDADQLAKLAGAAKVPVMVVGVNIQRGYAEQGWSEALGTAGYPGAP